MLLRTDLEIVQLPSPLPNFGTLLGKNTIQTDPNFNTKIVRLTDTSTKKGRSLTTADSPEAGIWNKDDTMLLVGQKIIIQFNPTTMQGSVLPVLPSVAAGKACFSRVDPSILYILENHTKINKLTFALINGVWTYKTTELIADMAAILPAGFKPLWTGQFVVSNDDTTFMVGYSEQGQGTGHNVCVWQSGHGVGKGYRMLNTQTGAITGDWGPVGMGIGQTWGWALHDCSMTPNPAYANLSMWAPAGTPTHPSLWNIPTLSVTPFISGGHHCKGMLHLYNPTSGGQFKELPYSDLTKHRLVVPLAGLPGNQKPPQKYQGDQHSGFGLIDPNDNSIFWCANASVPQIIPFTSCWMGEIFGYSVTTGVVQRACHHFNSGKSKVFDVQNAIACPSQTGKFVAFTSDIMGTLGTEPEGGPRGDVFVVQVG